MDEVLSKQLLKKVERLDAFEERFAMKFERISINVDQNGYIGLFFEVHPINGTTIENSFYVDIVLYDKEGYILDKHTTVYRKESFFGFDVDRVYFNKATSDKIERIRIFPRNM